MAEEVVLVFPVQKPPQAFRNCMEGSVSDVRMCTNDSDDFNITENMSILKKVLGVSQPAEL